MLSGLGNVQGRGQASSRAEMTPKPFWQCLIFPLLSAGCFVSGDKVVTGSVSCLREQVGPQFRIETQQKGRPLSLGDPG